jgi:hypothetical protein
LHVVNRSVHILLILASGTFFWWGGIIAVGTLLGKVLPQSSDFLITLPLSAYIGYWAALKLHHWDKPAAATGLDRILIQVGMILIILLTFSLGFRRGPS